MPRLGRLAMVWLVAAGVVTSCGGDDEDGAVTSGVASCTDPANDAHVELTSVDQNIPLEGGKPFLDLLGAELQVDDETTYVRWVLQPSVPGRFPEMEQFGWDLTFSATVKAGSDLRNFGTTPNGEIVGARLDEGESNDLDLGRATLAADGPVYELTVPTEDLLLDEPISSWSAASLLGGNVDGTPMVGIDLCELDSEGEELLDFPGNALADDIGGGTTAPPSSVTEDPDAGGPNPAISIGLDALRSDIAQALTDGGLATSPSDVKCGDAEDPSTFGVGESFACVVTPDVNGALSAFSVTVTAPNTYEWEYAEV